jgi:hypothetical protein
MNSRSSSIVAVSMAVLAIAAQTTEAFVPSTTGLATGIKSSSLLPPLYAEETTEETNSVFMPPADADADADAGEGEGDIDLSTVEMLGKGAAKVCNFFVFLVALSKGRRLLIPRSVRVWKNQLVELLKYIVLINKFCCSHLFFLLIFLFISFKLFLK